MYINTTTLEAAEVRRVLKIAQSTSEVERSVRRFDIKDVKAQKDKSGQLIIQGITSTFEAISLAVRYPELDLLFGQPRILEFPSDAVYHVNSDGVRMAYTQDYVRPISDILPTLDMNDEHDLRVGCQLINDYIDAQLTLCSYGMYDPCFKFTDNCAQGIPAIFEDSLTNFRIVDLGELDFNLPELLKLIQDRDWENITNRPEYTQLPPLLGDYFNDAMKQRFTEQAVTQVWCKSLRGSARSFDDDSYYNDVTAAVLDWSVPMETVRILRQQSNH